LNSGQNAATYEEDDEEEYDDSGLTRRGARVAALGMVEYKTVPTSSRYLMRLSTSNDTHKVQLGTSTSSTFGMSSELRGLCMLGMLLIMATPEKRMNEVELFNLIEEADPRLQEIDTPAPAVGDDPSRGSSEVRALRNWRNVFRHTLSSLQDGFFYRTRLSEEELSAMNELESNSSSGRHSVPMVGEPAVHGSSGDRNFVYSLGPRARGMLTTPAIAHAATTLCEMPPLETSKQLVEALRAEVHNADNVLRKMNAERPLASSG
jgi:hypothetical protein